MSCNRCDCIEAQNKKRLEMMKKGATKEEIREELKKIKDLYTTKKKHSVQ